MQAGHIAQPEAESDLALHRDPDESTGSKIERRLAAIFAADVAGYSRLMSQNEVGTLRSLTASREIIDRLITEYGGRIANTAGDSVLAEFPSAVDAVRCAVDLQDALVSVNRTSQINSAFSSGLGCMSGT
jgi:adenylate cyclase